MNAPADLDDLFNPTYDAGVRIHSNSWGCDSCSPSHPHFALDLIFSCAPTDSAGQSCNVYESQAQTIDRCDVYRRLELIFGSAFSHGSSGLLQ
jgi:hypothetical protein